jgi:hypothetical protein
MFVVTSMLHETVRSPKTIGGRTGALADVNAYGHEGGTQATYLLQHGVCGKDARRMPDGA